MPSPSVDVFTFITVYYKYGEYYSRTFATLGEGLQEFLEDYISKSDSYEDGIRRQQLEALPDEELLTEILEMGVADPFFILQLFIHLIGFFGRFGADPGSTWSWTGGSR